MKKAKVIFLSLFALLFLGFYSIPQPVLAGSYWDSQIGMAEIGSAYGEDPANVKDVRYQIVKIINVVLQILGLLVTILIIFAGFQWMTAGGNEDKVKKARSILINAVIGLVIIMLAWSITLFALRYFECIATRDSNIDTCYFIKIF
ncbi:MAG: pilin [Patescibacteria group bacterium]|nr:pilin [Patescibacteria group bacterium]